MTEDFKKFEKTVQLIFHNFWVKLRTADLWEKIYSYLVELQPLNSSSHFVRFYFKISRSCSIVPGIYDDIFYYLYHKKEKINTENVLTW